METRIVFMGTPDFAVASLQKLLEAGYNIVGVVTAPDKTAGRGLQLQQSAVKKYAAEKNLAILQPDKLKDPAFIEQLQSLKADLQVVVAFRMLPDIVWSMPPMGTINLHGSLLPQYRGAAPINWAIINGEKETGVTIFKLQHEIDTGNILLSAKIPIGEDESAGELHDKMKEAGAALLVKAVRGLIDGILKEQLQQTGSAILKTAPKIFTTTCNINWDNPAKKIHDLIRGLSPYPGAFTLFRGKTLKIFKAEPVEGLRSSIVAGNFETDQQTFLRYACNDGYINIIELQLEGKKKMGVKDFLRGYRFE
jgi:methionyl-tRNA formyltransferase